MENNPPIRIGLDLDGVLVDKPPLIPKRLLEWFFRGGTADSLNCRFPCSKFNQKIRKLSHFYLLRPPIRKNILFMERVVQDNRFEIYLISARYSFLTKETETWLKKRKIKRLFKKIYLNLDDEQPHLFKLKVLQGLKPKIYVDDDKIILEFLKKQLPEINFVSFPGVDLPGLINKLWVQKRLQ